MPVVRDSVLTEDERSETGEREGGGLPGAVGPLRLVQPQIETNELELHAEKAAAMLRSMGSRWRLLVLCNLVHGEKSVGDLQRIVGLSQSALSQHLAVLRRMKLVQVRRAAQTIYYRLSGREVVAILNTLYGLYCSPEDETCGIDASGI